MTRLLLGAVLLGNLHVCVTSPVPETLARPANVRFLSMDFHKNILHWTSPTNSSTLKYYVQWKIYGEPQWLDAAECQGIQKLQCNLSAVTSDLREWYYAKVQASSEPASKSAWALSPRFSPRWDTELSPPALKVNVTEQGIVVRVRTPKLFPKRMQSELQYQFFVTHTGGEEETFEMDCCSPKRTLTDLKPKTTYCVQAVATIPMQDLSSSRSPEKCVTTL